MKVYVIPLSIQADGDMQLVHSVGGAYNHLTTKSYIFTFDGSGLDLKKTYSGWNMVKSRTHFHKIIADAKNAFIRKVQLAVEQKAAVAMTESITPKPEYENKEMVYFANHSLHRILEKYGISYKEEGVLIYFSFNCDVNKSQLDKKCRKYIGKLDMVKLCELHQPCEPKPEYENKEMVYFTDFDVMPTLEKYGVSYQKQLLTVIFSLDYDVNTTLLEDITCKYVNNSEVIKLCESYKPVKPVKFWPLNDEPKCTILLSLPEPKPEHANILKVTRISLNGK